MQESNNTIKELATAFIEAMYSIYVELRDEMCGKSFAAEYPFGSDSINQDIRVFIEENNLVLSEPEKEAFIDAIYTFVH